MPIPEFIFVGRQNSGKSALIEAILGYPINYVDDSGGTTKRPIFFSLINNPSCDTPKCTLRRDFSSSITGADRDVEVPLKIVSGEIKKRQQEVSKISLDPIHVQIEYKTYFNMVLIDTPALMDSEEVEEMMMKLIGQKRHIICVEEANAWSNLKMLNFLKKIDPNMTRTTLVYTKFNVYLKSLTSTQLLNKYLGGKPREANCIFVSLFSNKVRSNNLEEENFKEKIYQAYLRDKNLMERIQFDTR